MFYTGCRLLILGLFFEAAAHAGGIQAPAPECTTNFKEASALFQRALGEDSPIGRIPAFGGSFKAGILKLESKNEITQSGDQIFLNTRIDMLGTDISSPVRVCREGNRLTATLIMSAAKMKNKLGTKPVQTNFASVPNEIVINISRNAGTQNVVFRTETFPDEPERSVTLR